MNNGDINNQLKQWEASAKNGDAKSSLFLANHFHDIGDVATAFGWYVQASKQKDVNPIVFFYLGYAYQYGEGTPIDMTEAFSMYKKAATYNVPQALYSLAYFYQNGIVVPKDEISAISYMKQATQKMDTLFFMQYESNAEKEKLQAYISMQRENVEYLTHQNEKLLKENGKLSEQITNAMNLIKERDKDKEKLMRQVKVAEQQALIQQKELTERYDQEILKLKDQFTELRNQISLLTERNIKLYNEIKEMSNHETELWKEIDVRDRSIQNYMQKIEEYKCLVNSTNLQLTQYKNELDNFKYEVEKLTRAVFRMTYWLDCNLCMEFASNSLSAFSKFYFTIDGVKCISVESFLQSLKFKNIKKQQLICDMPPEQAVKLGNKKKLWKQTNNLWWKGNKIKRSSSDYQLLLNCVFDELCKNNNFIRVLMDCGNIEILRTVNTIGRHSVMLSEDEFVSRLVNMRSLLQR